MRSTVLTALVVSVFAAGLAVAAAPRQAVRHHWHHKPVRTAWRLGTPLHFSIQRGQFRAEDRRVMGSAERYRPSSDTPQMTYDKRLWRADAAVGLVDLPQSQRLDSHTVSSAAAVQPDRADSVVGARVTMPF